MITRRAAAQLFATTAMTAALGAAGAAPARAANKVVKIGVDLSLTGADAQGAIKDKDAIQMAFDAANQGNAVPGYTFEVMVLDDGTATAGQYDPAQAATNARKMVSDTDVVAAHRAADERRRQGDDADPQRRAIWRPSRRRRPTPTSPTRNSPRSSARPARRSTSAPSPPTPSRARTWPTSMAETLHVKSVYILDDSGAYGVGLADAFQAQAEKKGIKVLGRDRLDPKAADYTAILTKIKSLNPDAIYYGGVVAGRREAGQAGL